MIDYGAAAKPGLELGVSPEKAIVDMLYLKSLGQRLFDTDEWDLKPVDKRVLKSYLKKAGVSRMKSRG
jgi:hypothetical protein